MITKQEFVELLQNDKKAHDWLDKLEDVSGICLYESEIHKCYWYSFTSFLKSTFNEKGMELIYWWLYEDIEKVIYDSDHKPIVTLNTEEDLYNYLINDVTPTYVK